VTGDIAYAGKRHEYDAAGLWLDELASRVGCTAADIQMVPGNHDVDRDQIKGLTEMMLAAIGNEGEAKLHDFLEEAVAREVLYLRFEEYRRFADAYQCPLDCSGNSSAERRVELADGRAIRFVRLNSALICSRRKAPGVRIVVASPDLPPKAHRGRKETACDVLFTRTQSRIAQDVASPTEPHRGRSLSA